MSGHTPGPWRWVIEDYSEAFLCGPDWDKHYVMAVGPCEGCEASAKASGGEWVWGRCKTPCEDDARLIAAAPALRKALEPFAAVADGFDGPVNEKTGLKRKGVPDDFQILNGITVGHLRAARAAIALTTEAAE
jgi:hypothetical protein